MLSVGAMPPSEFAPLTSRLTGVETSLTRVETELGAFRAETTARFDGLERQLATIDGRLNSMDQRFDSLQARYDVRFDAIDERILTQTRWSVGILALFGSLTALLMAVGQLRP